MKPAFRSPGLFLLLLAMPVGVSAQQARITKLVDVNYGTISNFTTDLRISQNICVFDSTSANGYRVTATGSGTGNAFTLASGTNRLDYEVEWNASSGQTTGTALQPGVSLTGQISSATKQDCGSGPPTSASLITILRTASVQNATSGSYSGTLTIVISPT